MGLLHLYLGIIDLGIRIRIYSGDVPIVSFYKRVHVTCKRLHDSLSCTLLHVRIPNTFAESESRFI